MDVAGWLRGLGLERYETVFREHAIDMDVLADLTDGELAQIGLPLGDRKRLLKAIASLFKTEPISSSKEDAAPAEANLPATPSPAPLAAGRDAERRPITVMFCDLAPIRCVLTTPSRTTGLRAQRSTLAAEFWRRVPIPSDVYLSDASPRLHLDNTDPNDRTDAASVLQCRFFLMRALSPVQGLAGKMRPSVKSPSRTSSKTAVFARRSSGPFP